MIINEILKYRKYKLINGEVPDSIELTEDQERRLKKWCLDNSRFVNNEMVPNLVGDVFGSRMIYGMKF